MTLEEVNKQCIEVDGIRYSPKTDCKLIDGEIDYQIVATAKEVYEGIKNQQIDICSVKQQKVQQSKELLAAWLASNPLVSNVHGTEASYTVTEEKQSLLTQNLMLAQLKQSVTTTWNCQGGICEEWTVQELSQLALEIEAYVRPRIKKQQSYEVQINACETADQVEAITIEYETIV